MKNKTSDTLVARNDYSKRPWKYEDGALRGSDGSIVSEDMHVLDAILTVRAVNSYEELLDRLKIAYRLLLNFNESGQLSKFDEKKVDEIYQAIAKAEGEKS